MKPANQRFAGRYRPPGPKRSPLITPEGAAALKDELDDLWRNKRPVITLAVQEAAALGDRSENAEYIYGKKMLREMDSRILYLQRRLDHIKVVEGLPADPNKVYFGAWVTLIDDDDNERHYRIVGADELNPSSGYISIDSPLALALIGKKLDDRVELNNLNKGYDIAAIKYSGVQPN
ncbi:MAG: transcription elongation factor GreB [Candidatus Paceibacteria bacterium]|jgi:transcription elongation factor GreB|tara:strand:- start:2424 stop:2954 length:531 start_codon:yes stop_codon:yes gene_type:complete